MFTTSGTYPWSFVTQIFHNGQRSHGGDRKIFEAMTSTLPKGTPGSVASLLAEPSIKEILIGTTSSGISVSSQNNSQILLRRAETIYTGSLHQSGTSKFVCFVYGV